MTGFASLLKLLPLSGLKGRQGLWACLLGLAVALLPAGAPAQEPRAGGAAGTLSLEAPRAMLMDFETAQVLFVKEADSRIPPASMSKIMTLFMVFEALQDGVISLDDRFEVSRRAYRRGGSSMFLEVGEKIRVEDLIRGIAVQSGNDASITIAEGLAGTEEAFARQMTERARALGMTGSQFRNATGWPDSEHFMTVRDLALLSREIIRRFPEYYGYFAEKGFIYNKIRQSNRNPLLSGDTGVDGIKTGHTREAGYGLTFSALAGGRRLIGVVHGLETERQRTTDSRRLLRWGFRYFSSYRLFDAGEKISEVDVWTGTRPVIDIVTPQPVRVVIPRIARKQMKVTLQMVTPLFAPVKMGDPVARLLVSAPGLERLEFPLVAGQASDRPGLWGSLTGSLSYLVFGERAKLP